MGEAAIEVLHIGSVSRDLADDDARGWRLGGGVAYAALTTARLGLRTAAVVGADSLAASAAEFDLLRDAGVEVRVVRLAESPVFDNRETPAGRTQTCLAPGQRLPVADLPATWRAAPAWSLVPVAGEVDDAWASLVPEPAFVALGWQGWLRDLVAGCDVARRTPTSSLLLRRADLVGVSRHDLPPEANPRDLRRLLGPRAVLLVTDGERGGCLLRAVDDEAGQSWRYEAVPPDREIDSTGAGDTYLGTLLATLVHPSLIGDSEADLGADLAFAAAAASLVIERPGLLGVPDVAAARARWRRDRPGRLEPSR